LPLPLFLASLSLVFLPGIHLPLFRNVCCSFLDSYLLLDYWMLQ
jgi:hypothetical protein